MIITIDEAVKNGDGEALVDLIMDFSKEYGGRHGAERESVRELLGRCEGFVCYSGESLIGAIGGISYWNPFNSQVRMLSEMFWYVKKSKRNSKAGGSLFLRFLEMGKEMNASIIMTTLDSTRGLEKGLLGRGFTPKERSWVRWAESE